LHPLSKLPGPKLAGASKAYLHFYTFKGQKHAIVERLHAKYGEVVRIAPNELSLITETAWKDIYMYRGKVRWTSSLFDQAKITRIARRWRKAMAEARGRLLTISFPPLTMYTLGSVKFSPRPSVIEQ
jgi:hypothetical protein